MGLFRCCLLLGLLVPPLCQVMLCQGLPLLLDLGQLVLQVGLMAEKRIAGPADVCQVVLAAVLS